MESEEEKRQQELRLREFKIESAREFRKLVWELTVGSIRNLEKALLTLSGGSLALSIAFIHQIAPSPKNLWILMYISWPLFILCILSNLHSFRFQLRAYSSAESSLAETAEALAEGKELPEWKKPRSVTLVRIFDEISIASFIIALIALTTFCSLNIPRNKMDNAPILNHTLDSLTSKAG